MWILISPLFIKYFTPKKISGISIFPFIILDNKQLKTDKKFINHEMIHVYQQMELMFIFFVLFYYAEFIILWFKYKNIQKSYQNISFEREAYENEANFDYLKTRRWFSFIKYW